MKRIITVAVVVLLASAAPAWAQGTVGEFAGSFTGAATDLELTIGKPEYQPSGFMLEGSWFFSEWLGVTGELGYATGSNILLELDTVTVAGGIRFRFPNDSIVTPSLRATVGLARLDLSFLSIPNDSANDLAVTIGGSIDFRITDSLAIRVQPDVLVVEHFDPVMFRFGFGIMYGFGGSSGVGSAPVPAPRPAAPVPAAVAAPPLIATPQTAEHIPADPPPAGPAGFSSPVKVDQSVSWTTRTATGAAFEWSATVRNDNRATMRAVATITLHDASGRELHQMSSPGEIPGQRAVTITGSGIVPDAVAPQADHWIITVVWG